MTEYVNKDRHEADASTPISEMTLSHGPSRAYEVNDQPEDHTEISWGYETNCLVD